jgi:hypothetical protein
VASAGLGRSFGGSPKTDRTVKAGFASGCLLAMIKKLEVDKEILAEQVELDRITE